MNTQSLILLIIIFTIQGCAYPFEVVYPLKSTIIDADTKKPISDVHVIRSVCDIHASCPIPEYTDRGITDKNGRIRLNNKRKWSSFFPAPGGMPISDNQIIIFKEGYYTIYFSQYSTNFEDAVSFFDDLKISKPATYIEYPDGYDSYFINGVITMYKVQNDF